ncbi:MAG TPA: phosphatase PAP2 family protein, partial [Bryobacteraceae bacterium]|nr:phosphatase PAP2 family protein [Bryobacteraceae bacterium]
MRKFTRTHLLGLANVAAAFCLTSVLFCQFAVGQTATGIEPTAGNWRTWIISSGKDFRVAPPPDAAGTAAEIAWLRDFNAAPNAQATEQIRYWDAGSPGYRWIELISERVRANQPVSAFAHRAYTYVSLAVYDATVAAWESKYFYNRPRPSEVDPTLATAVPNPKSPSYPSEHAAAAAAAAAVLSYLLPNEASSLQALAEEAGRSRLLAGVNYPSDIEAGAE